NLTIKCDAGNTVATLTQQRFTINYPDAPPLRWKIPVQLVQVGPDVLPRTVVLDSDPLLVRFDGCSNPIEVNPGDSGYYVVRYDHDNGTRLAARFATLSTIDRDALLNNQWMLTRAGLSDVTDVLNLMAGLPQEDQPLVVMSAIDILRQID